MDKHTNPILKLSYFEAFITSFVVGLAENYFATYAIQSGHSALISGLLVSVPLIFAALIQFFSQPYLKQMSVSTYVRKATLLQSVPLLFLAGLALFDVKTPFIILLILYSVYWLGHFSIQPMWNRWISEIVPTELGQHYFALRTRLNQIGIIAGLIIGGLTLHLNVIKVSIDHLYFGLFLFSFFCKVLTYFLFQKHPSVEDSISFSRGKMFSLFKKYRSFLISYSTFNFSIYLSAPFVAGYLLKERNLNYFEFMVVMLGLFAGKVLTSTWLRQTQKKIDPTKLMFYGGLFAAPLPALWPLCQSPWLMMFLHIISGIAWAAWEVGLSLCFFNNIKPDQKIEMISLYHYVGVFSQVAGTVFGAFMISSIFNNNYDSIFIAAGIVRLICVLPLRKNTLTS